MHSKSSAHTRREIISRALTLAGAATLIGTGPFSRACAEPADRELAASTSDFSEADIRWLDEVAETILPETDTPGAKAAATGAFIALMVSDTYSPQEQQVFRDGMGALESACERQFGSGFLAAAPAQRLQLLEQLDVEQKSYMDGTAADAPAHYFRMIKELTLLGYFTSEIGYQQALRYVETPGRYDPCVEHVPGERAWARHA